MSIITKNQKVGIFAIFIASALMLGTISVSGIDTALATKDKHDHQDKSKSTTSNSALQSIEQTQFSNQETQCVEGESVLTVSALYGDSIEIQLQDNLGGNTAGQDIKEE